MCYFTEVFMTCFAYITQLTRSELDWIMTAHEHLNAIDDYLEIKVHTSGTNTATTEMPSESLTFVENLKNTLIVSSNPSRLS